MSNEESVETLNRGYKITLRTLAIIVTAGAIAFNKLHIFTAAILFILSMFDLVNSDK